MNKFIDNVYKIHNNPFVLTPLIVSFYEKLEQKPKNILLAYLILPLVLNERSKQTLQNVNKNSSIHSFMDSKDKAKRENVFGLPERIQNYIEITNQCIQYAIDNQYIKIKEDLSIEFLRKVNNKVENLNQSFKASSNLHKIFRDLDVVTIYRLLGVKEL
jgi:tRNA U34 5-carboxymethylaminomethyl modifying GTPase MnmE/TrmE